MSLQPHHDGSALYVPQQAPSPGETVPVFVRVPAGAAVEQVYVRSISDGEPRVAAATVDRRDPDGEVWWRADVVARNPVTRYRFSLVAGQQQRWLNAAGLAAHDVPDASDFRLLTHAAPPAWAADAVVYQIFPDRFARSAAAAGRALPDWAIPCDWDTPTKVPARSMRHARDPAPSVVGRGPETPYQFYGGDLDGIAERLDHVAALGANAIYLTPIFPARSNHRYDAASFATVDPLLGGDAALARLAAAVHARGWRLLGDLTTNHTGDRHEWFTAALGDAASAERGMYYVDPDGEYEAWYGIRTLPKLNWGSAELARRFTGVVRHWLRPPYGLDGWRVDVANMTGRLRAEDHALRVAALLRAAAVTARDDALVVAEHTGDGTGDLDAGGWHGTMNYAGFARPVWSWLRRADLSLPDAPPHRDGAAVVATMRAFAGLVSWRSYVHSWQLLGSHDTARIATVVGDRARVEVAVGLLMTLPGTPMVFAGDELGLTADVGEAARTPMPWHRPRPGIFATFRDLVALRRREPGLRRGGLRWLHAGPDALVFLREASGQALLVLARRAPGAPVRLSGLPPAENVYGGAPKLCHDTVDTLTLPGDGPTFQVWNLATGK